MIYGNYNVLLTPEIDKCACMCKKSMYFRAFKYLCMCREACRFTTPTIRKGFSYSSMCVCVCVCKYTHLRYFSSLNHASRNARHARTQSHTCCHQLRFCSRAGTRALDGTLTIRHINAKLYTIWHFCGRLLSWLTAA